MRGRVRKSAKLHWRPFSFAKKMRAKRVQAVSNKVNHHKSFYNTIERTFEDTKHAIHKTREGQRCILNIYW